MDLETRERLILEHQGQVELIASGFAKACPMPFADLVCAGVLGLIAAVDNFQPSRGLLLKTYAERRIRGAILDMLRGEEWASRHRRKKAKGIEAAAVRAGHKLLSEPDSVHVAAEMGVTLERLRDMQEQVAGIDLGSLDAMPFGAWRAAIARVRDESECATPGRAMERQQIRALLSERVCGLPPKERAVILRCFYRGMTLPEVAAALGIHVSRVSTLKSQGLAHLRMSIRPAWPRRGDPVCALAA